MQDLTLKVVTETSLAVSGSSSVFGSQWLKPGLTVKSCFSFVIVLAL